MAFIEAIEVRLSRANLGIIRFLARSRYPKFPISRLTGISKKGNQKRTKS